MRRAILKIGTTPCIVCGEPIEKRRRIDGTFKQIQPQYCGYRCWYHKNSPRLRKARMQARSK